MNFCDIKKLLLAALFTSAISSHTAMASYISDGSSGEFHPLFDTILDLSNPANFPQFSNVYIDAGIHITVRTPDIGYGYLLSADGIYLNGFLDAGTGSLSLNAINSIVMGNGSQLIGGNLTLSVNNLALQGEIKAPGGTIQLTAGSSIAVSGTIDVTGGSRLTVPVVLQPKPIINWQIFNLDGSGSVNFSQGGDISLTAPVPLPAASILLGSGLLGLLSFGTGRRRC